MTPSIALLLGIIGAGLVLLAIDRFPADVIGLCILAVLSLAGLLPPGAAFAGFGSDTVVMIFGLLVLTAALTRTGVVDAIGRAILRFAGDRPRRLLAVITVVPAAMSALISNTATTALFVPIVLGLARRLRISASRLLMPLAFATILASSVTLISSSTNIVIGGLMVQYGMLPLGMFELSLVGLPVAAVGLAYLLLLGPHWVPEREAPDEEAGGFAIRPYMAEVVVLPDSPLIGKTLLESGFGRDLDLTVLRVLRPPNHYLAPRPELRLQAHDELVVKGQHDEVLRVKSAVGIGIKADVRLSDPRLRDEEAQLAEALILPRSPLVGRTLKGVRFRQRYGLQVLGLNRRGKNIYRKLSQIPLRAGDQVLVQGPHAQIATMDADNVFRVLGFVAHQRLDRRRAPVAIAVFGGVLLLAALNVLSLPLAILLGLIAIFATRCITPTQAYREVEWKAIVVIGAMLGLGSAMAYTGTAAYLAAQIAHVAGGAHPLWLLGAFFALTLLLTQPMSNQAAAVVVVPVAIETALQLGLNTRAFAVMIAVAASCSFLTPLEPACLLVYGPGRYRFADFVRFGALLTVLVFAVAMVLVPLIWPL
ncbi:MAG: SLC13 family permease [Anaerolineae bacterium]|nr:SLC13 family permease [Anaerolineae bacterium]